jgi:mRNA-degrading endonuclease HigB of HigAB toxin-antitoxin module
MNFVLHPRIAPLLAAMMLLLSSACGNEDASPANPFDQAAIEKDLKERPLKKLYEEYEKASWTPPSDGKVTSEQVEGYVQASRLMRRIADITGEDLDRKIESANYESDKLSRMATAFSAIGSLRNNATAGLRAATTLGLNPKEMDWVDLELRRAAGRLATRRALEKTRDQARDARDRETHPYLREEREGAMRIAEDAIREHDERTGDAERANAALIRTREADLRPFLRALRRD